jgi:hypothetical protein
VVVVAEPVVAVVVEDEPLVVPVVDEPVVEEPVVDEPVVDVDAGVVVVAVNCAISVLTVAAWSPFGSSCR